MSNGFVLVLLREMRESILKLREECNARQDRSDERQEQALINLNRIENDLNELKKFMRQIALNQAKQEQLHLPTAESLDSGANAVKEQLRRFK